MLKPILAMLSVYVGIDSKHEETKFSLESWHFNSPVPSNGAPLGPAHFLHSNVWAGNELGPMEGILFKSHGPPLRLFAV